MRIFQLTNSSKRISEELSQCVIYFLKYLLGRCSDSTNINTSKVKRGAGAEADYRLILENYMSDILLVLGDPEWPVAEQVALIYSRLMIQHLDDIKKQGESQIKAMALEWFGQICSQLRQSTATEFRKIDGNAGVLIEIFQEFEKVFPKNTILTTWTSEEIQCLWGLLFSISKWIESRNQNSAQEKNIVRYLASEWMWTIGNSVETNWSEFHLSNRGIIRSLTLECCKIANKATIVNSSDLKLWKPLEDLFGGPSNTSGTYSDLELRHAIKYAHEILFATRTLNQSLDVFMTKIMTALDSEIVTIRSKALKALQEIIVHDPNRESLLKNSIVQKAISNRIMDQSASVRDAAIEVIGKYLVGGGSELVKEYYKSLRERILDVSTSVRKRIIKLLKEIYLTLVKSQTVESSNETFENYEIMMEIAVRLLGRLSDEEDTVKDLALKSVQEIWFTPFHHIPSTHTKDLSLAKLVEDSYNRIAIWPTLSVTSRQEIRLRAKLISDSIMTSSSVVEMFGDLVRKSIENGTKSSRANFVDVCIFLVQDLTEEILRQEESESNLKIIKKTILQCFTVLYQIGHFLPGLLVRHVAMFHPYLNCVSHLQQQQNSTEKEISAIEQKILQMVILILEQVIPQITIANFELLSKIENDLLKVLNSGSHSSVSAAVSCLCIIVSRTTKHFLKLVKTFKTCIDCLNRSKTTIMQQKPFPFAAKKMTWRCLLISTQLMRCFDFDKMRTSSEIDNKTKEEMENMNLSITELIKKNLKSPILEVLWSLTLFFTGDMVDSTTKSIAISALGPLFIAYPKLMLREATRRMMDDVFAGVPSNMKIDLIRTFVDFLIHEQSLLSFESAEDKQESTKLSNELKRDDKSKVNLKILIGNADEMGDAGVSSSIMQTYLSRILEGLVSHDDPLQQVSFDCVVLILEQGLVHPLLVIYTYSYTRKLANCHFQCVPAIAAIESGFNEKLRERAFKIHKTLNERHSSFIHTKNLDSIKQIFEFQIGYLNSSDDDNRYKIKGFRLVQEKIEDENITKPDALINKLYSLVQPKKLRRNEFLNNAMKVFDFDFNENDHTKIDVAFVKFVAENIASLDFKPQEEVLHVIHRCLRIISVSGETILKQIETWKQEGQSEKQASTFKTISKASICISILLVLKNYLQTQFNLNDQRCLNYVPSDSGKGIEKPVIRQSFNITISWEQVPFANKSLNTDEDFEDQCTKFYELMSEDWASIQTAEEVILTKDLSEVCAEMHIEPVLGSNLPLAPPPRKKRAIPAKTVIKRRKTIGPVVTIEDFEPVQRKASRRVSMNQINYQESDDDDE
ncbi:Sister chromatid cohesion protein 2 [Nowakowskiella sp. JEL0078]|nr:Sister chromatid cohesion protein 2 [Nowakowskiella sp. JEL0078]